MPNVWAWTKTCSIPTNHGHVHSVILQLKTFHPLTNQHLLKQNQGQRAAQGRRRPPWPKGRGTRHPRPNQEEEQHALKHVLVNQNLSKQSPTTQCLVKQRVVHRVHRHEANKEADQLTCAIPNSNTHVLHRANSQTHVLPRDSLHSATNQQTVCMPRPKRLRHCRVKSPTRMLHRHRITEVDTNAKPSVPA